MLFRSLTAVKVDVVFATTAYFELDRTIVSDRSQWMILDPTALLHASVVVFGWVVGSVAGTSGDMTGVEGESGNNGAGADDT